MRTSRAPLDSRHVWIAHQAHQAGLTLRADSRSATAPISSSSLASSSASLAATPLHKMPAAIRRRRMQTTRKCNPLRPRRKWRRYPRCSRRLDTPGRNRGGLRKPPRRRLDRSRQIGHRLDIRPSRCTFPCNSPPQSPGSKLVGIRELQGRKPHRPGRRRAGRSRRG